MLNLKSLSALLLALGTTGAAYSIPFSGIDYTNATQQDAACTGIVKDAAGETIIGASVIVKGTTNGTITGIDGDFTIPNVENGAVIQISFVGYQTQEVVWNGTPLNIILKDDTQTLEEVVVVAFGTQKKVNVTGSVSSVGAEELTARPVNNVTQALQGTVPGMNISTGSGGGALNSSQKFNIRGIGTIGAGSSVTPLVLIDGMEGDINAINPQDIENISVLKDAAASSIYGSRAPGGVILITTKQGKSGKISVNYNNNFRINSPLNMAEMADSYSFALATNDLLVNGHASPMYNATQLQQLKDLQKGIVPSQFMFVKSDGTWNSFDDPERKGIMPIGNTDWLKFHFGNSFTQEHSLSVNGGSEKVKFYLSTNYLNQGGLLNFGDDSKQRYSVTGKINADLAEWFKLGYSIRFNRNDFNTPQWAMNENDFYFNVIRYWPVIPAKDPNGYYTDPSAVYQLENGGRYKTQSDVVSQQLSMIIEPVKDWRITAEMNYRTNYNFSHLDRQTVYQYKADGTQVVTNNYAGGAVYPSSVEEYMLKSDFFNPNIFTEYSKTLDSGHYFKVLAGFQSELYKQRDMTGYQAGIMSGIPTLNTTQFDATVSGGYSEWATVGFFGRLNYDYKGRYLAEVNMRYDGTSRFLRNNRWNLFPSFSLGWNIAREAFFEDFTDVIGNLKLRGSWGQLGNQNTDNWYPFYQTMNITANGGKWLVNGVKPNISSEPALVSSLLTWEKTETMNIGLDLGMLNNRLTMTFDYFQRKSKDMVGPAPELPVILGTAVPKVNNLDMTSKGWELQVSWRDQIEDFNYGISFNLSDSKVVIDRYPNPSKSLFASDGSTMYYDGATIGDIWGYETIGIAHTQEEMDKHLSSLPNGGQNSIGSSWAAGDIMYADLNGDGKISQGDKTLADHGDLKLLGNNTPRYNFGLNLDAAWKGFDLKVFFQGTLKRDYMPTSGATMFWGQNGYWQMNFFKPHLDYFRAEADHPLGQNLDGYYPRPLEDAKNRQAQSRYMQNAAYCRLKNVTLGYTLPAEWTKKFYVNNMRLFVSGENLLTITSLVDTFDPETIGVGWYDGATYPLSKTISFGLSLTL